MDGYICLDIGGTNIRAALFSLKEIAPVEHLRIQTIVEGQKVEERVIELISTIWPKKGKIHAIAAAAPGYVDSQKGIVLSAVNIPGWSNLPLRKILRNKFNVPVLLENDARLAAMGEWRHGSARGHHDVLYLTISTGIGGGVIINDRVLKGSRGMATELGHITLLPDGPLCNCGHRGHLEALSSGPAIARFVLDQLQNGVASTLPYDPNLSSKEVAEAARKGDPLAKKAFDRAGEYLGLALSNFIHIFNPTCIVLGGGVSLTGNLLMQPVRSALHDHILNKEYLNKLSLITAELGDNAGLIGALTLIKTSKT